jgi:acetoin utilization deacetylase AcuC-like enzyme
MLTIYSDDHHLHHGRCELIDGQLKPCFEMPSRADHVLQRVKNRTSARWKRPRTLAANRSSASTAATTSTSSKAPGTLDRIQHRRRLAALHLASPHPARSKPTSLHGQLGYYSFDGGAPITAGTWQAAYSAAQVALTAQAEIQRGAHSAFALCRHRAPRRQRLDGRLLLPQQRRHRRPGLPRCRPKVAILDVDYHHGNGTQSIFYERSDVLFTSIHGHPEAEFPFFLGYADAGEGEGEGFNFNYPLPAGSGWDAGARRWNRPATRSTATAPTSWSCRWASTPSRTTRSRSSSSTARITWRWANASPPRQTDLFVMEGGYAVEEIGINAVNVLEGFEQ